MSGAVPPIGRLAALLVLGLLLWAPSVSAAPMEADLLYEGSALLEGDGTWLATDGFVDLHAGESVPPYGLQILAEEVTVLTQTWDYRKTDLGLYGDETSSKRQETETRHLDAEIVLDNLRPGSRITLASDAWSIEARFAAAGLHNVQDVWATADPEDDEHVEDYTSGAHTEGRLWSHTVHLEDQVLLEPGRFQFLANGDLAMTLYEGDLTIGDRDGTATYTSGELRKTEDGLLGERVESSQRQLLVVTFRGAELTGQWGGYSRLAAEQPILSLDGTIGFASASGTVVVDRIAMRAHEDPLHADGKVILRPRADPTAEALPFDPYTEEVAYYGSGRLVATGDADQVILASAPVQNPFSEGSDILLATGTGLGLLGMLYAAWRFGPLAFAALYSRLQESDLLENPIRAEIYRIVCANPGISARRVHEHAEASWGTVVHHLGKLEAAGLVSVRANGRAKSYYENHGKWEGFQDQLALLARDKTRLVAFAILKVPGRDQNQIMERTQLPQSTVSYHLLKLEKAGLISKDRTGQALSYFPTVSLRALSDRIQPVSTSTDPTASPAGGTA